MNLNHIEYLFLIVKFTMLILFMPFPGYTIMVFWTETVVKTRLYMDTPVPNADHLLMVRLFQIWTIDFFLVDIYHSNNYGISCFQGYTGWCISFGLHIFSCRDYNLNFPAIFGLAADARLPQASWHTPMGVLHQPKVQKLWEN